MSDEREQQAIVDSWLRQHALVNWFADAAASVRDAAAGGPGRIPPRVRCPKCDRLFDSISAVEMHERQVHVLARTVADDH